MKVLQLLEENKGKKNFSFEVLPPLKGNGTEHLFSTIEKLKPFGPLYINITNHNSEYVYRKLDDGLYLKERMLRRPGTVAIAAAIQNKFHIPVIPHVICSGATAYDIEYELLDLQFLGLENLFLLRGDKGKDDRVFTPVENGYSHATELIKQVNQFNEGKFIDGTPIKHPGTPFGYGVACYPEKHEEAPNLEMDMQYLKMKQDLGASYAVTQLFYDNDAFYRFVDKARAMGITLPIIPGIKPFAKLSQITMVPKTFHCDMPQQLAAEAVKCKSDEQARALGIEWTTRQVEDLYAHGVPCVHYYTVSAVDSICEILKRIN